MSLRAFCFSLSQTWRLTKCNALSNDYRRLGDVDRRRNLKKIWLASTTQPSEASGARL